MEQSHPWCVKATLKTKCPWRRKKKKKLNKNELFNCPKVSLSWFLRHSPTLDHVFSREWGSTWQVAWMNVRKSTGMITSQLIMWIEIWNSTLTSWDFWEFFFSGMVGVWVQVRWCDFKPLILSKMIAARLWHTLCLTSLGWSQKPMHLSTFLKSSFTWELTVTNTYPILEVLWKMIFLFPRWDMLVPCKAGHSHRSLTWKTPSESQRWQMDGFPGVQPFSESAL